MFQALGGHPGTTRLTLLIRANTRSNWSTSRGNLVANLPYVAVTGTLETMLEKIREASVPDKFSQDFVSSKLAMKGGSARSIIPFIKKMGLVTTDGTPTDRYKEFRNPAKSGRAIAKAMKELYAPLFEMNVKAHTLDTPKLRGLVVEATGSEPNSASVQKTLSTFTALRAIAVFDRDTSEELFGDEKPVRPAEPPPPSTYPVVRQGAPVSEGINLSYTINLNLPATTDIEIFNAIFQSLKQHLLQE